MGLETSTPGYISDLDKTWPLGTDPRSQGDDHVRYIKKVLKNVFPGVGGDGFNTPITAKESEINFLAGVTSNIQDQLTSANDRPICIVDRGGANYGAIAANVVTKISYTDVLIDSHSGWDAANFWYVCPKAGYYRIKAQSGSTAAGTITRCTMQVVSTTLTRTSSDDNNSGFGAVAMVDAIVPMSIGDTVYSTIQFSGGAGTGNGNAQTTYMEIEFVRPF